MQCFLVRHLSGECSVGFGEIKIHSVKTLSHKSPCNAPYCTVLYCTVPCSGTVLSFSLLLRLPDLSRSTSISFFTGFFPCPDHFLLPQAFSLTPIGKR